MRKTRPVVLPIRDDLPKQIAENNWIWIVLSFDIPLVNVWKFRTEIES